MRKTKIINWILDLAFLLLGVWWVTIQARGINNTENYYFNLIYAFIALYGGIIAYINAREWGGIKSLYGQTLIALGSALIFWGIGGLIWAYYNFGGFSLSNLLNPQTISEVPYPGLPDLGFGPFFIFCIYGLIALAKAIGIKYVWQTTRGKVLLILTPIISIALTFIVYKDIRTVTITAENSALTVFTNYYYNVGNAFVMGLAINLLFLASKFSGGKLKTAYGFITAGLISQYIADFFFNYRASSGIYYNADFTDMLYIVSLYLLSIGCSLFTLKGKR